MSPALYAARLDSENRRESTRIILDAQGNVTNPVNPWGHPWSQDAINYAQDRRSYAVYSEAMNTLDAIIGEDRDVATRNAYTQARNKFQNISHAESMIEKLQQAAKGGNQAALIAYAAACTKINELAFVDFSWYLNQEEASEEAAPAPASPVVAPDTQEEATTLVDAKGRTLTASATGWQAKSSSQPGDVHKVAINGTSCTCHGWAFHSKCWHTTLVRSLCPKPVANKKPSFLEVEYQL